MNRGVVVEANACSPRLKKLFCATPRSVLDELESDIIFVLLGEQRDVDSFLQETQAVSVLWLQQTPSKVCDGLVRFSLRLHGPVLHNLLPIRKAKVSSIWKPDGSSAKDDVGYRVVLPQKAYSSVCRIHSQLIPVLEHLSDDLQSYPGLAANAGTAGSPAFLMAHGTSVYITPQGIHLARLCNNVVKHGIIRINLAKAQLEVGLVEAGDVSPRGNCCAVIGLKDATTAFSKAVDGTSDGNSGSKIARSLAPSSWVPDSSMGSATFGVGRFTLASVGADAKKQREYVDGLLEQLKRDSDDRTLLLRTDVVKSLLQIIGRCDPVQRLADVDLEEKVLLAAVLLLQQPHSARRNLAVDKLMEGACVMLQKTGLASCLPLLHLLHKILPLPGVSKAALAFGLGDVLTTKYAVLSSEALAPVRALEASMQRSPDKDEILTDLFTRSVQRSAAARAQSDVDTARRQSDEQRGDLYDLPELQKDLMEPLGASLDNPDPPLDRRPSKRPSFVPPLQLGAATLGQQAQSRSSIQSRSTRTMRTGSIGSESTAPGDARSPAATTTTTQLRPRQQVCRSIGESIMAADLASFIIAKRTALHINLSLTPAASEAAEVLSVPATTPPQTPTTSPSEKTPTLATRNWVLKILKVLSPLETLQVDGAPSFDPRTCLCEELLASCCHGTNWLHGSLKEQVQHKTSLKAAQEWRMLALEVLHCYSPQVLRGIQQLRQGASHVGHVVGQEDLNDPLLLGIKEKLMEATSIRRPESSVYVLTDAYISMLHDYLTSSASLHLPASIMYICGEALVHVENLLRSFGKVSTWQGHVVVLMQSLLALYTDLLRRATTPSICRLLLSLLLQRTETVTLVCEFARLSLFSPHFEQLMRTPHALSNSWMVVWCYFNALVQLLKDAPLQQGLMSDSSSDRAADSVTTRSEAASEGLSPGTLSPHSICFTTTARPVQLQSAAELLEKLSPMLEHPGGLGEKFLEVLNTAGGREKANGNCAELQAQVLQFLVAAFSVPANPFLNSKFHCDHYIHFHFLHFIRYYEMAGPRSSSTLRLCLQHLEVLRGIARHPIPHIKLRFYQIDIMDFLAREIGMGVFPLRLGEQYKASSSAAVTPVGPVPVPSRSSIIVPSTSTASPLHTTTTTTTATSLRILPAEAVMHHNDAFTTSTTSTMSPPTPLTVYVPPDATHMGPPSTTSTTSSPMPHAYIPHISPTSTHDKNSDTKDLTPLSAIVSFADWRPPPAVLSSSEAPSALPQITETSSSTSSHSPLGTSTSTHPQLQASPNPQPLTIPLLSVPSESSLTTTPPIIPSTSPTRRSPLVALDSSLKTPSSQPSSSADDVDGLEDQHVVPSTHTHVRRSLEEILPSTHTHVHSSVDELMTEMTETIPSTLNSDTDSSIAEEPTITALTLTQGVAAGPGGGTAFSYCYDLEEDVERLLQLEEEMGQSVDLDGFSTASSLTTSASTSSFPNSPTRGGGASSPEPSSPSSFHSRRSARPPVGPMRKPAIPSLNMRLVKKQHATASVSGQSAANTPVAGAAAMAKHTSMPSLDGLPPPSPSGSLPPQLRPIIPQLNLLGMRLNHTDSPGTATAAAAAESSFTGRSLSMTGASAIRLSPQESSSRPPSVRGGGVVLSSRSQHPPPGSITISNSSPSLTPKHLTGSTVPAGSQLTFSSLEAISMGLSPIHVRAPGASTVSQEPSTWEYRPLDVNPQLHLLLIELIMELLLTPQGMLDRRYSNPDPSVLGPANVLFLLHVHLLQKPCAPLIPPLLQRAHAMGPAAVRLLRLTIPGLFRSDLCHHLEFISRGQYAHVYSAQLQLGHQSEDVIIKALDMPQSPMERCTTVDVFSEIAIMERFRGQATVCQLYDYGIAGSSFYLVLRRYRCSLKQWRLRQPVTLTPSRTQLYLRMYQQVIDAVSALASTGVVHYDLKCDNLLLEMLPGVSEDEFWSPADECERLPFRVVVADFGESTMLAVGEEPAVERNRGTEVFKSPEMLAMTFEDNRRRHRNYDRRKQKQSQTGFAHDVWSLGCVLFELLTSKLLFVENEHRYDPVAITNRIIYGGSEVDLLNAQEKDQLAHQQPLISFFTWLMIRDPAIRPTLHDMQTTLTKLVSDLAATSPRTEAAGSIIAHPHTASFSTATGSSIIRTMTGRTAIATGRTFTGTRFDKPTAATAASSHMISTEATLLDSLAQATDPSVRPRLWHVAPWLTLLDASLLTQPGELQHLRHQISAILLLVPEGGVAAPSTTATSSQPNTPVHPSAMNLDNLNAVSKAAIHTITAAGIPSAMISLPPAEDSISQAQVGTGVQTLSLLLATTQRSSRQIPSNTSLLPFFTSPRDRTHSPNPVSQPMVAIAAASNLLPQAALLAAAHLLPTHDISPARAYITMSRAGLAAQLQQPQMSSLLAFAEQRAKASTSFSAEGNTLLTCLCGAFTGIITQPLPVLEGHGPVDCSQQLEHLRVQYGWVGGALLWTHVPAAAFETDPLSPLVSRMALQQDGVQQGAGSSRWHLHSCGCCGYPVYAQATPMGAATEPEVSVVVNWVNRV